MKEFAIYTAARLGLFVLSYVVVVGIYLLVTGGSPVPLFWPFLVAVLVSAVASVYLLRGQREKFALAVHERAERAAARRAMVRAEEERGEEDDHHAEGERHADEVPEADENPVADERTEGDGR